MFLHVGQGFTSTSGAGKLFLANGTRIFASTSDSENLILAYGTMIFEIYLCHIVELLLLLHVKL